MSVSGYGYGGNHGCPCTNTTLTLASVSERHCKSPAGDVGIRLTIGGSCVPFSYGSSHCLQHDLLHDQNCNLDAAGERLIPAYCVRPWCYVDLDTCKRESDERAYRSSYFAFESGIDLFYSYSACNSTAEDWFATEEDIVHSRALGGISIDANVPTYIFPMMYKRDSSNEILSSPGSEYYDDTIPYEGVYLHYVERIIELSNGDIRNISLTHRSKASGHVHPTSSFTAAVQDIEDGLVDMAVGPFWITGQRLKIASFTLPIVYDRTLLVIPRPGTKISLTDQAQKVLAPFSYELWGIVIGIIAFTALLSVWYSDRSEVSTNRADRRIGLGRGMPKMRRRKRAYARLALDSCLQKGLFFCSAGVEQDESSSLPTKLLLFGFGFFILISVSAYVANLAAFLTLPTTDAPIKTIDGAIAAGLTICAHTAIEAELEVAYPDAKFYFHDKGREFHGVLEDYEDGKCQVMAIGYEDTSMDVKFIEKLCRNKLVFTNSLVLEIPIAFPIRSHLTSGFSYWMYQGEKYHGTSIQTSKDEFPQDIACNVQYSEEDIETSVHDKITVQNFFLPIMVFLGCSVLSVIVQVYHLRNVNSGRQSLVGRASTMSLVAEISEDDEERRRTSSLNWVLNRRRSTLEDTSVLKDVKDDDEKERSVHETECLKLDDVNYCPRVTFEEDVKDSLTNQFTPKND